MKQKKLLFLTLVHPDFLPPVYASAQTLRDSGYEIHILTFDSLVVSDNFDVGKGISLETVGQHHNVPLARRLHLRKQFKKRAAELLRDNPVAILAFCSFSYLTALKIARHFPIIYYALEIADFTISSIKRSPLSQLNRLLTLKSVGKAALLATPSAQRSAWLAGRCKLEDIPKTILNTSYLYETTKVYNAPGVLDEIIPHHFLTKKIILYTGAVNDRLCIFELVKGFDLLNDPEWVLIVTGFKQNEYCAKIRAFAETSQAKSNMLLLPYVTRLQMLGLQEVAQIGACFSKEFDDIVSKMIAPNKVGEYLNTGLFLVGNESEYMKLFKYYGVAALSEKPEPAMITETLRKAIDITQSTDYKSTIRSFVQNVFCMQKQLEPIHTFLGELSEHRQF